MGGDGVTVAALTTWAVATPLAMAGPGMLGESPFSARGMLLPLGVGALLLIVLVPLVVWRGPRASLAGLCVGLFSAWIALALRSGLFGTPYGSDALGNDKARLTAMATRYSTTWWSTDHFVPSLPNDYPPLFPWLVGRYAAFGDVAAWRLTGFAEALTLSVAVLAACLLWRRIVPPFVALTATAVGLVAFDLPEKSFAVFSVLAIMPWVVLTLGPRVTGRLHWLPAGLIAGVIFLSFYGYFIYAGLGLAALCWCAWREEPDRRAYAGYLLKVAAVAFAVTAWFVVPFAVAAARVGLQVTVSRWMSADIAESSFPFLEPTVLGVVQLVGLGGLVWYRRTTPWATPLLFMVVAAYLYRGLTLVWLLVDGLNRQVSYTTRLVAPLLAVAGVLTIATAARGVAERLALDPPRGLPVVAGVVAIVFAGYSHWEVVMPAHRPSSDFEGVAEPAQSRSAAARAHYEMLPNGRRPRFAPEEPPEPETLSQAGFPAWRVKREVEARLGEGAAPVTLSWSERLFSFIPWPGYVGNGPGSANGLVHWDDRTAEITKLSGTRDPVEFARRAAATRFGPIDVFVLYDRAPARWEWTTEVAFTPAQFDPRWFEVVTGLPEKTVIAIRRR